MTLPDLDTDCFGASGAIGVFLTTAGSVGTFSLFGLPLDLLF